MTSSKKPEQTSMWETLPKAEQEAVRKALGRLNNQEPTKPPKAKAGTFQLKGYVRCELSSADKDAFREWESSHANGDVWDQLIKACDSGYLVKMGESGQGAQASLSALSTEHGWDGYVLTAHAATAARAAALLVYKHAVLMLCDWQPWVDESGEDFFR